MDGLSLTTSIGANPAARASAGSLINRFISREEGSTAIIFALVLPLTIAFCGLAVDYSRTQSLNNRLHQAADAAALAAVAFAYENPTATPDQASAAAQGFWDVAVANLPGQATISSVAGNGVTTTTVAYKGSEPSAFAGLFGVKSVPVSGTSVAQSEGQATQKGGMTGTGLVWGDPHVVGADGASFTFQCPVVGGWYSMLSDAGIQVNVTCVPYGTEQVVSSVSVVLQSASGKHTVQFTNPVDMATFTPGQLTVDGKTFIAPSGTTSYADGEARFTFASSNPSSQQDNVLAISTPQYQLSLSYGTWGTQNEYFTIAATGAGKCNPPGGFWGTTLIGINDMNGSDFLVNGPGYTAAQFNNATCAVVASGPHLIK